MIAGFAASFRFRLLDAGPHGLGPTLPSPNPLFGARPAGRRRRCRRTSVSFCADLPTRVGRGARGRWSPPRPASPGSRPPVPPPDQFCPGLTRGLGWDARENRVLPPRAARVQHRVPARGAARDALARKRSAPRAAPPRMWAKARDEVHPVREVS